MTCSKAHILIWDIRALAVICTAVTSVYAMSYQTFLKRLKRARVDAGLTQSEVASRMGRYQSFVSKCESGERRVDAVELTEFAALYGKPVTYFLKGLGSS